MAFEVYAPAYNRSRTIAKGSARFDSNGNMRVNAEDLEDLGIEGEAVVLIDRSTRRIALRRVRPDDTKGRVVILGASKKQQQGPSTTRVVRVLGALRALGEEPSLFKGTHSMIVKDDMLVIPFGPSPMADAALDRDNPLRLEQRGAAATPATGKARRKNG